MADFIPNEPQNGEIVDADVLRQNFQAVHEEATTVPTLTQVLTAGGDGGGQTITGVSSVILGTLGTACIQMYATGGPPTAITVESQAGNKAVVVRAGENPGDEVGVLAIGAPLALAGAGVKIQAPLILLDLPVADPHVVGAVWNDAGTLKVSAG